MNDDLQVPTADMLEIYAGGGNGAEYVNVEWLCETAAAELREKYAEITRLRAENERLRDLLRLAHSQLFMAWSFRGYEGGPLSEPAVTMILRRGEAALKGDSDE